MLTFIVVTFLIFFLLAAGVLDIFYLLFSIMCIILPVAFFAFFLLYGRL